MSRNPRDDLIQKQVLVPTLRPGDVVLDNLALHQWPEVQAAIERARARAAVPAALQPILNPIELAIAKLKAVLCFAITLRSKLSYGITEPSC